MPGFRTPVLTTIETAPLLRHTALGYNVLVGESGGSGGPHLFVVQICRAALLAGGGLSAFGALAHPLLTNASTIQRVDSARISLQCALVAIACGISSLFYRHLYGLRRLRVRVAYSNEANSVASAMRLASWSVVIGLLAWVALLLRGPFIPNDRRFLNMTYTNWLTWAPILACINVWMGIPGGQAARMFSRSTTWTAKRTLSILYAGVLLCFGIAVSACINVVLHMPTNATKRSAREVELALWMSWLWVFYPLVNTIKTLILLTSNDVPTFNASASEGLIADVYTMLQVDEKPTVDDARYGHSSISVHTMRLLDTLMAVVDMVAQALLGVALATYAFPV